MKPEPMDLYLVAFQSLASGFCACGAKKRPRHSFCLGCYRKLPTTLCQRLYVREGYTEAWSDALKSLGLSPDGHEKPSPQLTLL